jgi:hypothetical protein
VVDGKAAGADVEYVEAQSPVALSGEVTTPTAFAGGEASLAIALGDPDGALRPDSLTGALRSPSGKSVALAVEAAEHDAWNLHASLPASAEPGSWSVRVDARGVDRAGRPFARTVELALVVALPVAKIASWEVAESGAGVTVRARVLAASRFHAGVRATMVCAGGERRESQASGVLERGHGEVTLSFAKRCRPGEAFAIEGLALVDHDQAATLDYEPSLAVRR